MRGAICPRVQPSYDTWMPEQSRLKTNASEYDLSPCRSNTPSEWKQMSMNMIYHHTVSVLRVSENKCQWIWFITIPFPYSCTHACIAVVAVIVALYTIFFPSCLFQCFLLYQEKYMGLLLFLSHINDILSTINHSSVHVYTDDNACVIIYVHFLIFPCY